MTVAVCDLIACAAICALAIYCGVSGWCRKHCAPATYVRPDFTSYQEVDTTLLTLAPFFLAIRNRLTSQTGTNS
jgi:hypothetical protein